MPGHIVCVVAKYNEDTQWTRDLDDVANVVVYDKKTKYKNVGREAETFARAIMEHWGDMMHGSVTHMVFLQGHPFDHAPKEAIIPHLMIDPPPNHVIPLGRMHVSDAAGFPDHPNLPVAWHWHTSLSLPWQTSWEFVAGAQYIVPAKNITRHGLEFWKRIHSALYEERICPWTMERYWYHLFKE